MTAFTVRLSDELAVQLDALAAKLDRSRSHVAAQAIGDFVLREAWQLAEIEVGLDDADRGDFATEDEVASVLEKHLKPSGAG